MAFRRPSARSWVLVALVLAGSMGAVVAALGDAPSRAPVLPASEEPRTAAPAPTAIGRGRAGVRFSSSACMLSGASADSPTGRTIVLDAGHGGAAPGALTTVDGVEVTEADVTLAVVLRMREMLRREGHRVLLTRTEDTTVARTSSRDLDGDRLTAAAVKRDLEARNVCANAGGADVQVAVHLNSFGDGSVRGAETLYNPNRPFSKRNRALAEALHAEVLDVLSQEGWLVPDRGVATDTSTATPALTPEGEAYGQLLQLGPAGPPWFRRPSRMPGALVEPLFLTAPEDAERIATAEGQSTLAEALVSGIGRWLELRG